MIVDFVHLPPAYAIDHNDPAANSLANERMLSLLRSLDANGVLVIDEAESRSSRLLDSIRANIETWPERYRQQAMLHIDHLLKHRQIVQIPTSSANTGCQLALDLSLQVHPDGTIGPRACACGGDCMKRAAETGAIITMLDEFSVSPLAELRGNRTSFQLAEGEPNAPNLLNQHVWRPLFRHTKTVKLYDAYIGRKLVEAVASVPFQDQIAYVQSRKVNAPDSLQPKLHRSTQNLIACLRHIAVSFQKHSLSGGTVEVYTEVASSKRTEDLSPVEIQASAWYMHDLALQISKELQTSSGTQVSMNFVLIDPRESGNAIHDRYLVTDQATLLCGRGFDLFDHKGCSKGIAFSRADDASIPHRPFYYRSKHVTPQRLRRMETH